MDKIDDINFIFEIITKNCNNRFITGFLKEFFSNQLNISTKTIKRQLDELKNNNTLQVHLRKKIFKSLLNKIEFNPFKKEILYFDEPFIIDVIEFTKSSEDIWGMFIFYQYIIYHTIFEIRKILKNSNTISVADLKHFKELNKIYTKEEIIEIFRSLIELGYLPNKEKFQQKFLKTAIFENIDFKKLEKKYFNNNEDFDNSLDNSLEYYNLTKRQKRNIKNFKSYRPKNIYINDNEHFEYTVIFCLEQIKRKFFEN